MEYTLKDLLDIPKLKDLLDSFDEIHRLPSAILDIDGTVLIATGWQDICANFHRINPATSSKCRGSDISIAADLNNRRAQSVYHCPMGLIDAAMPVIVGDNHIGNVFIGQFLTEPPDEELFREQAHRYGFDEEGYLASLRKVPQVTEERFRNNLNILHSITQMLAELGLQTRQQAKSEAELRRQNRELENSQKLLKESEERFKALHDASFGGVIIHDRGIILDCNQALSDMTGYTHGELIGMDGLKLIAPDSLETVLINIRSGYSEAYEVEGIRKDNSIYPLAIRGKNIVYAGRKARVIEFRDISMQKNAEIALKESERNLRNTLMNLPVAIAVSDAEENITFRNKRFIDLFGYGKEDVSTITEWWQRAYPDEKHRKEASQLWAEELRLARENNTEVSLHEFPVYCKSGRTSIVERSAIILGKEVLTAFVDVTERKKIEEKLQESELRLRELIEQSPVGLVLWKMDGGLVSVNSAFTRIVGCNEDEALLLNYWTITPEKYVREEWQRLENLHENELFGPYEKEIHHRDGLVVPVRVNSMTVFRDGEPYLWSSVEDITALKIAEKQKAELADQLRQSQKMEAIGTLAGGIAHDFNNILSAILGYTELSLVNPNCDDKTKANLTNVLKAVTRARDLVKQILTYSRKGQQERELVSMQEVVLEAVKLLRKTIPTTVAIGVNVDQSTGTVLANGTQIHQVVMNLCTNAFHALPEQGGRIEINLKPVDLRKTTTVRHQILSPGRYALLSVTDNGCGISPENIPLIFDPFFTTKMQGEGTGMGLAVIDGIVRSHNGSIDVESCPEKGSTFKVMLPLTTIMEGTKSSPDDTQSVKADSEHILLVDDEVMLINIGKEMLESMGFNVSTASSAAEALELFLASPELFDVIVTDQTMPGMSGLELARQVIQVQPDFPVIICTGHSAALDIEKTKKLGVRAVFMKPYSYARLAEMIRGIFEGAPVGSGEIQS